MLDLLNEEIIRLRDARKLPWLRGRNGGQLDIATLHRWSRRGLKGVRLETARIGATTYTSIERILDFLRRLNEPSKPAIRRSAKRQQQLASTDRRLDEVGIK